ncbi:aldo/keto reductase [Psychroserpens sp. MEBiC05023]
MNIRNGIGLGTAALGRPQYINVRQEQDKKVSLEVFRAQGFQILEQAYTLGLRYFDTAPGYGLAEQLLLDWLKTKSDPSIQIATKWGYTYVANFDPNAKIHEVKEHSLNKLNEQWNISKAFMPHLKVYQIHSATFETGVLKNEAVLNRLAALKNEHDLDIAITTTGANQIEVLKQALDISVNGTQLFDAFQVTYNILDQSLSDLYTELHSQNKRIIIKEALANGRLFRNEKYAHYFKLYMVLEGLSQKYQVGVDAIALKFCQQTVTNSIVLSGVSNVAHLESNLKVNSFQLSQSDIEILKDFSISATNYWNERKQLHWN